ncbi:reticulata-like protein, putative [Actinidia rufa]|uniref:Reticulata-like protein, putative n=1 Tax=Actinidia rufa TaxID=165716 RepID=A0A7J0FU84_9ERIC|nr:reticulata-like protein, putative [Actinidia rufa]
MQSLSLESHPPSPKSHPPSLESTPPSLESHPSVPESHPSALESRPPAVRCCLLRPSLSVETEDANKEPEKGRQQQERLPQGKRHAAGLVKKSRGAGEPRKVDGEPCEEVQKRGKDFWAEFELYLADLLVGVVVNVALVGMLAPYACIGQPSLSKGAFGRMQNAYAALPSSVFEAERPGCRFSVKQRIATYFFKGVMYASVGFACGLIGQGIANLIMTAKRTIRKSEEDIPVPPLLKSAALWGMP